MRTSQQRHCSPPGSGPELLARTQTGLGVSSIDTLPDLYAQWECWAIDVSDSHSAYLPLVRFRSSERWTSWVTSLFAVLDSAALPVRARSPARLAAGVGPAL
jgi:hypothetical protein